MERFCRDCKWARNFDAGPYRLTCDAPQNMVEHISNENYLVSGIPQEVVLAQRGASCTALRRHYGQPSIDGTVCGPAAAWFVERVIS